MSALDRLVRSLDRLERSPESIQIELAMQFGTLIRDGLRQRGWTQRRLAEVTGKRDSAISEYLYGDENPTIGTIAEILFALDIRPQLVDSSKPIRVLVKATTGIEGVQSKIEGTTDGEEQGSKVTVYQGASTSTDLGIVSGPRDGRFRSTYVDRWDANHVPQRPSRRHPRLRKPLPGSASESRSSSLVHDRGSHRANG
ncbi:MAG: helix-turn-helix transcriptional regulator [Phycisphaeraceae bacterium]|nr:helix-turn-helix transcriptional regulator [Phycisphaeraceae bacterium]